MEFLLKNEPRGGAETETLGDSACSPSSGPSTAHRRWHSRGARLRRREGHFSMILFYTGNDLKDESVERFRDNCQIKHRNTDSSSEERLLVVIELLDDVADETWSKLYSQRTIARRTIVTSRSQKIARLGTTQTITLKPLPVEPYWYFFKMAAIGSDDPALHPEDGVLGLGDCEGVARVLHARLHRRRAAESSVQRSERVGSSRQNSC